MMPSSGIDFQSFFESAPGLYLILKPDFTIIAVNDAYLNATMTNRKQILGRGLFEVFPDNPDDPAATGVSNLRASLNYVLKNKLPHTMSVQKYDIRRPDGTFEERFWSPLNKPVLNDKKELKYIIHCVEDVTKRKQAEDQLKESEEKYTKLFNSIDEGFCIIEMIFDARKKPVDYRFLVINASFERQTGLHDAVGKRMREFAPDHEEHWFEIYGKIALTGESVRFENRAEQLRRWYDVYAFRFGEPKNLQVAILFNDITERKKAEKALQESLKETLDYKYALDESSIVAITDQNGIITYVNDNFCKVSKFNREELVGRDHSIIKSGFHPKEFISNLWATIVNGKVWRDDVKNKAKDGTYFWLDTTIVPFLDEQGKPYQYVTIRSDITQRKELEEKISLLNRGLQKRVEEKTREVIEKEQQYRFLLQNMREGIQLIGYDWKYLFINNSVVEQSKYSNEELLGHTMMEKYPGIENTELFKVLNRCMKERIPELIENEFSFPDGTKEWYELSIQPVQEGLFILSMDITKRKKAEEKLKKYTEELKSSNDELERFAYVASHDLQEPLRMVSSFLNLLEEEFDQNLSKTAREYIHYAVDGAGRMKILVNDLLSYSRVGTNKEEFIATDLNEAMDYVTRVLDEDIKKNQAVITVNTLPVITANKILINQLFMNLVSNALKYRSDKKPEIEIGYTEEKHKHVFYVKDNGIGIDPRFFDKIFIIFQRLHNKAEYSGTGIGLAICKKIVETHKGNIWLESQEGKGSTFYFSIPKHTI